MTHKTKFQPETVAASTYIAPNATVVGDVAIGHESSVWFGAVIRGDVERIEIGEQTNIQDLSVLHADRGYPCILGNRVTVGHAAIVHGASVGNDVMIGMRAVVMNGAEIGEGSIIGVGAVVTEGTEIPPGSIVLGIPGKVKRGTNDEDKELIRHAAQHYVEAAKSYSKSNPR